VIWIADTAAYFTGKRFGKRKLAPLISPGNTWEGVLGAWVAVSIYGAILCIFFGFDYWLIPIVWGVTVLSIMGDLLESLIKRQANVKDSSNLLPGHGGMLDRIDGLTSSLPLAAFFIYFPIYYATLMLYV
jgi:phosphatidate cytidylyltransferase